MSEVRFQAESALIEQQKKKQTDNTQVGNNKPSGIDFKNDTVLVAAKASFMDAQAVENSRLLDQTTAAIDLAHTESDISVILGEFQNIVNQLSQAQAQSASLSSHSQSVMEQIASQNETISNLEASIAESSDNISLYASQIVTAEANRNFALNDLNQHKTAKANAEARKDALPDEISSLDTDIKNLEASITSDMTEDDKKEIEAQINSLKAKKAAKEAELKDLPTIISNEEKAITDAEANLTACERECTNAYARREKEEENFQKLNEQYAEAVLTLTGLTLQQASLAVLLKESQTYETNLNIQLKQVEEKIAAKEAEKEEKQKTVDKATEKADKATENAKEKEAAYNQEETAAKGRAEKEEQKNIFMA